MIVDLIYFHELDLKKDNKFALDFFKRRVCSKNCIS